MQNPTGWCCGWLKIRELAHGFSVSYSINVSPETFCIKRKGFIWVFVIPADTGFSDNTIFGQQMTWVVTWNVKNAPNENKYLLTFRLAISSVRCPIWPEKNPLKHLKIFISEVKFSTSEVENPFLGQKKRRKPSINGPSPLRYTNIQHFSPKSKSL